MTESDRSQRHVQREDWPEPLEPMPAEHVVLDIGKRYDAAEFERLQMGFCPTVMEEKWLILFEDNRLYLHRSWTGYCVYIAEFQSGSDGAVLTRATVNRDRSQYSETSDPYDAMLLLFLIDAILLHKPVDFPEHPGLDADMGIINQWTSIGKQMFDEPEKDRQ